MTKTSPDNFNGMIIELVFKELNHLLAILNVYGGGLIIIRQKEKANTFTLLGDSLDSKRILDN